MKKFVLASLVLLATVSAKAQIINPVHWSYAAKKTSPTEAVVFLKATMDKGWHIYSQNVKEGGPIKTSFTFDSSPAYALVSKTQEPKPITKLEKTFDMEVSYFENSVIFQQKVKLKGNGPVTVKGKLEYMSCNDHKCLPPDEVAFSIPVK
ncbi:protein-disulfide reductase DsbD domain-containing protein [Spirosoma rhododendri]|uniref:Sugar transporter n=1 Tax=Spirosoma rhododendri TaxID=2728024 RepID=A0A7L5DSZ7_9BACT|nr:protein-disulfide reductase DsbD domain-containing protein [Spirosoma rhododendri]QJD80732.1 sugar transporter [Spirosoma rhododendri]